MAAGSENIRWSQLRYAKCYPVALLRESLVSSLSRQALFNVPFVTCDTVERIQVAAYPREHLDYEREDQFLSGKHRSA